jgi:hypothetical protein
LDDMGPILVTGFIVLAIIVKMLLNHQQKMTALVHQGRSTETKQVAFDQEKLEREIVELKQLVMQQSIALDNLSDRVARTTPEAVQNRLSGV